jgi:putative oxidoreductase
MDRWLGRHAERIYAILRVITGILFACHGAQKLFGALGGTAMTSNPMMLVAGIIEFGGGLLIAIGLFTSWAAFLASGQMAVAYFMVTPRAASGPSSTRESWPSCTASCSSTLRRADRGRTASTG